MYAAGCPRAKILYTIDIKPMDGTGNSALDSVVVNSVISYGMISLNDLPSGNYEIHIR